MPETGHGRLWQIPLLLYFSTDSSSLPVYVRFRTDDFFVISSVDRMAYRGVGHVVHGWCARQPPVHCVWHALCRSVHCRSDTEHPKRLLAIRRLDTSALP